jgi:alpha-galactosidase
MFAGERESSLKRLAGMADDLTPIDALRDTDSEGALELIETIAGAGTHYHVAANLPNYGQIANLPHNSIVETPVLVDGAGIHPIHVGPLPEAIAELCRRELIAAQIGIDAAVTGDRQKALQCLLLDPVITDIEVAKAVLEDYLLAYKTHLPQFWK